MQNQQINELRSVAVENLFAERKDFIIIGLTGRTGSGCSTVGSFLTKTFKDLQPPRPNTMGNIDERQYEIIYNYSSHSWEPFRLIEMKHIIFTFIMENTFEELLDFIKDKIGEDLEIDQLRDQYNTIHLKRLEYLESVAALTEKGENVPADDDIYQFYFVNIPNFFTQFQKAIPLHVYTKMLQTIGDNIRSSGHAFDDEINPSNIFNLAQRVNMMIKILRRRNITEHKKVLVVIDAFRNPYEASFFKDRYSSFYLFSVNSIDDERRERLNKKGLTYEDILQLDKKEYPKRSNTIEDFYRIDIEKTIEIADVHINNKNTDTGDYSFTKQQIIRYVSLIMHPGLVSPTKIERCMQIAHSSKLNSGCISRQVGAVITDSDYTVLSVGWNCAPSNQIPCNLRDLQSLIRDDQDDVIGMSTFERTNSGYKEFLKLKTKDMSFEKLSGRLCAYCFKDAYNAFIKEKNQVYTRSIHAEEMAFLQISKLGGTGVKNGCLFTTASPCELCSKKAYQTGIQKIYYIDQYPGISYEHILNCGESSPQMILFNGAIGRAYNQFYTQILSYKDELYMLLDLNFKD